MQKLNLPARSNTPFSISKILGLLFVLFGVAEWLAFPAYYKYFIAGIWGLSFLCIGLINYKYIWYVGVFAMPLSMSLDYLFNGASITLPSDFIAIGLCGIVLLQIFKEPHFWLKQLEHPITQVLLLYLIWMGLTCIASVRPVVSLKFLLSAVWYVGGFFLASLLFFRVSTTRWNWLFLPVVPLCLVVGYTIVKHWAAGFSYTASINIMQPFYKEHTAYAASIVIFAIAYFIIGLQKHLKVWNRIIWLSIGGFLTFGVATSYTRGAWLGFMVASGCYILLIGWQKYKNWFIGGGIALPLILLFGIQIQLNFNDPNDRSKTYSDHLFSVLNTRTDLSNIERFNRWRAAYNMMEARPLFGFGPGVYAMEYSPYQESQFKTHISTNQGTSGTAHNEFLLAASELGIPGALLVALLYFVSLRAAWLGFQRSQNAQHKTLYAIAFCGLTTYYVHALVNNFLDQDKVAIPVYLCLALIVALDFAEKESTAQGVSPAHKQNAL